jgi:hypothetical protein
MATFTPAHQCRRNADDGSDYTPLPPCVVKCYQHSKKKCASGWTNRNTHSRNIALVWLSCVIINSIPHRVKISTPPNALTRWGVCEEV